VSGPHGFAVRRTTPSSEAPPASIASNPASVTIAIRPTEGLDSEGCRSELRQMGTEIFLQKGLDRKLLICPSGNQSALLLIAIRDVQIIDYHRG
jgi:hypothetical protein